MKPGNVYIKHGPKHGVYLHTKNNGDTLPKVVYSALKRAPGVWNDPAALTRVVFSEMVQGHLLETGGFGIGPFLMENFNYITVLDPFTNKLGFFRENGALEKTYTFAKYTALIESNVHWSYMLGEFYPENVNDFTKVTYNF